jgi:cell division septation protein DedD
MLLTFSQARDQSPDIQSYLNRIANGHADEVRPELQSLLSTYPNNPGVLYLQGVLTSDGTEAVRIYQSIVDNFPKSEWADDALYKVYQFYYAIGLYRTAEIKLNQLKTDYPQSKYVTGVASVDVKNLPDESQKPDSGQSVQSPPVASTTDPEKPSAEDRPPVSDEVSPGQYTLQVGAYSQQVNAEKQKLFFEDLGFSVDVLNKVKSSRSLFVVLVGEYKSADEARAKGAEIKKKYNINSMVVTK